MNIDKLIYYFQIDKKEFIFQLQSNPNYPSALAFSDTLNFMGIKNDAYELEKEYWEELPQEFITIYKNNFALVHKNGDQATIFAEKEKKIPLSELKNNSTNFILLFERTREEKSAQNNSFLQNVLLFSALGILLLGSFLHWNLWSFIYQILSFVGVYLFLEIFKEKSGAESPVLQNFCGVGSQQKSSVDSCKTIIQSNDFELLGLKFSDYGFIYFISLSVLPLLILNTNILFLGISGLALFSVFYSIFYQLQKKSFCKICALVIAVLISQFIIAFFSFRSPFQASNLLVVLFVFIVSFLAVYYFSKILNEKEKYRKENIKYLRFKRNYELFKNQLINADKIEFETKDPFFLGNRDAKLHLSMITNPYCGFCKDAHKIIEDLLQKYPTEISVQLRFNYFSTKADEKYTSLIKGFASIYKNKNQNEFLGAVEEWFNNKDEDKILQKTNDLFSSEDLQPIIKVSEENINVGISFTPVFIINGYQFPTAYDREDIFYFIDELLEDNEI